MNLETPDTPVSATPPEPQRDSPGAIIREARERKGFSQDDLAIQTKLTRAALDALERDDFVTLLEPVYVRGYYRKCAKVLGLSEQQLIEAYGKRTTPKAPQLPAKLRLASGSDLGSGSHLPVPLAVVAAVVAIVVCGVAWVTFERSENNLAPAATTTVRLAPAAAVEPVAEMPAATLPAPVEEGETVVAEAVAQPVAEPAPAAESSEAAAVAVIAGSPDTAVLRFGDRSWVRIDDANGKVLLRGEFSAGETRVVRGAAPLNVHLGNANALKVEYGGKTVDFSSQLRSSGTARFTLPLTLN